MLIITLQIPVARWTTAVMENPYQRNYAEEPGEATGGSYQGLAPRCHFVSLKILDGRGNGDSVGLIRALHWLLEAWKRIRCPRYTTFLWGRESTKVEIRTELISAVEEAWDAGFVICAAAEIRNLPYSALRFRYE